MHGLGKLFLRTASIHANLIFTRTRPPANVKWFFRSKNAGESMEGCVVFAWKYDLDEWDAHMTERD
ncbi:MAG TPA: hypothetical protein DCL41_01015 [Bdellovibrionales bacterium]|nr:hypothetical protein [Bdellovibrionales bacterium]|tara:strand:+ start:1399 stop:1596 length:198 start_codon:yes stop_codon:yes gene_type:complete